jgi:hypothetical protein
MADLMTECNYLNPDVEVIAEVNTGESFDTFAESINTGHGLIGTTHASDIETLVNRIVEQGLPPYLLREIDLVVFPRRVDGERYVGEVVELLGEQEHRQLADDRHAGVIEKRGTAVYWHRIAWRTEDGGFAFADDVTGSDESVADAATGGTGVDDTASSGTDIGSVHTLARVADMTDRPLDAVEAEFERKHRYVQHMVREGIDDFDALFDLLADLQTNEAATVERLNRQAGEKGD